MKLLTEYHEHILHKCSILFVILIRNVMCWITTSKCSRNYTHYLNDTIRRFEQRPFVGRARIYEYTPPPPPPLLFSFTSYKTNIARFNSCKSRFIFIREKWNVFIIRRLLNFLELLNQLKYYFD